MTTQIPQSLVSTANINVTVGALAWADASLAAWLKRWEADGKTMVTLVYAEYLCAVFADDGTTSLDRADSAKLSIVVLRRLARHNRLFKLELPMNEFQVAKQRGADWHTRASAATLANLNAWTSQRDTVLGQGRGRPLKASDEKLVWHDAGGRCMYRGCGRDVGRTSLTPKAAAAAYLAHIVASDQDGPRGDSTSQALSDNPENVMLMCDEHHRLIDRIDVEGHTTQHLREMRREHSDMVRRSLDGLAFPRTKAVALLADVANLKTSAGERDIQKAVLQRRLSCLPGVDFIMRRTHRDDRTTPDFWHYLLHEHEPDLLELRRRLGNSQPLGDGCDVLSIFPLHPVPLLVLFGRMVGEARAVEVYQYDRIRSTWCWNDAAVASPPGTFMLDAPNSNASNEVLLTIEITAEVDVSVLPEDLAIRLQNNSLTWVRIRNMTMSESCIATASDLAQYTDVARRAVKVIQDEMRASHVHLIGIGPVSTLFRFGQLLQPGHHCEYTVYDRPNFKERFRPALKITGESVASVGQGSSADSKIIQLR